MRKITGTFLICTMTAASLSLSSGCGTVTVMTPETTVESRQEQIPARPQDDFYRYVNEEYLKNVEFKYGESSCTDPALSISFIRAARSPGTGVLS